MSDFRKRVLEPALIPLGAFVFIGILVFGFSRFLLTTTTEGAVVLGTLMSGCILFAAAALAKGGTLKPAQRVALVAFGVMVIGGGVTAGAVLNTREVHKELEVADTITALNLAFDKKELKLPADEPFALEFINSDSGIPHNVAIYRSPTELDPPLFKGEIFSGVATREYEIEEGLPAGAYFFQCDVHTNMNGAALVGEGTGLSPGAPQSPPPGGSAISLIADKLAFDKTEIVLPANKPSVIDFDNREVGVQHNVAIYPSATSFEPLFRGELITGPAQRRYEIPPLPPGTYQFRCDVHPQMAGTVIVR